MELFKIKIKDSDRTVELHKLLVLRQAFVVAGSLIWIGLALAFFVHTYFIALPIVVGAGLLFSGLSGVCPMVALLNFLPGNRPHKQ